MVPFWVPVPYYNGDPKRDYNFDNHPNMFEMPGHGLEQVSWAAGFEAFCPKTLNPKPQTLNPKP